MIGISIIKYGYLFRSKLRSPAIGHTIAQYQDDLTSKHVGLLDNRCFVKLSIITKRSFSTAIDDGYLFPVFLRSVEKSEKKTNIVTYCYSITEKCGLIYYRTHSKHLERNIRAHRHLNRAFSKKMPSHGERTVLYCDISHRSVCSVRYAPMPYILLTGATLMTWVFVG